MVPNQAAADHTEIALRNIGASIPAQPGPSPLVPAQSREDAEVLDFIVQTFWNSKQFHRTQQQPPLPDSIMPGSAPSPSPDLEFSELKNPRFWCARLKEKDEELNNCQLQLNEIKGKLGGYEQLVAAKSTTID